MVEAALEIAQIAGEPTPTKSDARTFEVASMTMFTGEVVDLMPGTL